MKTGVGDLLQIIVDASNVAHFEKKGGKPSLKNLLSAKKHLKN